MTTTSQHDPAATAAIPLCLDLDGTVCLTDTLHEAMLRILRHRPWMILLFPIWALGGKPYFKSKIAGNVKLEVDGLPYNARLMEYLKQQRELGRKIILITGANERIAKDVADHLGVVDEVIASTADQQMTGLHKLEVLKKRFGSRGFDYAGDSRPDLLIWPEAREAIYTGRSRRLMNELNALGGQTRDLRETRSPKWTRLLRVHQWSKNVIVFVPLLASHKLAEHGMILRSVLIFIAMCLCASGTYIVNDLLDLPSDRKHSHKKSRPFAAGDLPITTGFLLAPFLIICGLAVAVILSWECLLAVAVYITISLAYSLELKRRMLVDVFTLAALYTIRLIAGHTATGIAYSAWLLGFSIFLFLSLALVKRVSELYDLRITHREKTEGRGYISSDLELLESLGLVSGGLAVLILALYVNNPEVTNLYAHPLALLALCPILFYWLSRLWLITHRGNMHSDPVVFALRDRISYYLLVIAAIVVVFFAHAK